MPEPLWSPTDERVASAGTTRFIEYVNGRWGTRLDGFEALHRFSVESVERFWTAVWDFCGVRAETRGERVLEGADRMPGARFFPEARLNFAENLLRRSDDAPAMVFRREDGLRREMSWRMVGESVAGLSAALRRAGVGPGDRVAAWLPNVPETVIAMLATAAIGATFTSTSPDFGVRGVLDRFGQTSPTVLFAADAYVYGGRTHDCLGRLAEIRAGLPSVRHTVVVPYVDDDPDLSAIPGAVAWDEFFGSAEAGESGQTHTQAFPLSQPLYVLYSSGTTGAPKCIVHGAGGILLKHLVEHRLHCDVRPGDRVFYFTTAGWMMWNWLASALASEATLVLYDGSPFHRSWSSGPDGSVLLDLAQDEGVTLFGTSAKWIDAAAKAGLAPNGTHDLSSLRTITSTGSPLAHESFDWVYGRMKRDVHLASISGGTDICGCFVAGDPTSPVWRGEIQRAGLGMAVDVYDDTGRSLSEGQGELVCTRPFPSMPVGFWDDPGDVRYRAAYFERFPGVWHHGDFISRTEHGGFVIHGRSDATLNPGGVRIGTAEIYRQVERFDEIAESIAIGQAWDGDTRIVLFVRPAPGVELTEDLRERLRRQIRDNCTPRHVPAVIVAVDDIPRTKSGKITELAVRDVVEGRAVPNTEALANPEALALYRDLPELGTQITR